VPIAALIALVFADVAATIDCDTVEEALNGDRNVLVLENSHTSFVEVVVEVVQLICPNEEAAGTQTHKRNRNSTLAFTDSPLRYPRKSRLLMLSW
jgi:hypothetical protein